MQVVHSNFPHKKLNFSLKTLSSSHKSNTWMASQGICWKPIVATLPLIAYHIGISRAASVVLLTQRHICTSLLLSFQYIRCFGSSALSNKYLSYCLSKAVLTLTCRAIKSGCTTQPDEDDNHGFSGSYEKILACQLHDWKSTQEYRWYLWILLRFWLTLDFIVILVSLKASCSASKNFGVQERASPYILSCADA